MSQPKGAQCFKLDTEALERAAKTVMTGINADGGLYHVGNMAKQAALSTPPGQLMRAVYEALRDLSSEDGTVTVSGREFGYNIRGGFHK
jgi:hypothetical protein